MTEDFFFLILGLLALFYLIGLPIMVFMLFARTTELRRRLDAGELPAKSEQVEVMPTQETPVASETVSDEPEAEPTSQAGPWDKSITEEADADEPAELDAASPPKPQEPGLLSRFAKWLSGNWVYAVSALSLALAGIFLVQYGVESGLLPPTARVIAALIFGVALIGASEWVRRRSGDEGDGTTVNLPSVFSGAGIVSLFGGILAARNLYDLIGAGPAFGGLFAVTLLGLALGWFYGPMLASIGLIGGFAAPFVVDSTSQTPQMLYLYFGGLAILGLGIDTVRRWAWVSGLTLILGVGAGWLLWVSDTSVAPYFAIYLAVLTLLATMIPARSVWPDHQGRTLLYSLVRRRKPGQPIFPVWLSAAMLAASCAGIILLSAGQRGEFWLGYALLIALTLILAIWSRRAPALQDLTLLPMAGCLFLIGWLEAVFPVIAEFSQERPPESGLPMDTVWILLPAALVSLTCAWRSSVARAFSILWAIAATVFLPAAGLILEMVWNPAQTIGAYPWALQAVVVAAVMVLLAERFARIDGPRRDRVALATMSALATVAFALSLLFTTGALTIALAAVVVLAAGLDRAFKLRLMEWFILAGIASLGYRLLIDPGLDWALYDAPVWEALLSQGSAFAACLAGLWLLKDLNRERAKVTLDSAAWGFAGVILSTALYHAIDALAPATSTDRHWSAGLHATIWLGLALAQLYRLGVLQKLRIVRLVLAAVLGLTGLGWLAYGLSLANPALGQEQVLGWPLINTLIPAYLTPALVLGLGSWRLAALPVRARQALAVVSAAVAIVWVFLTVRHYWQGGDNMNLVRGFTQPELYSYTLVFLIAGGALFYQSLARHSSLLRRLGLGVIALAIAKVFLVDISGLTGLIRVFSLLALGLLLAGMAWLDRWAQSRATSETDT